MMTKDLVVYSMPAFWPRCPHYYVEVNGKEIPVYSARVSAMPVNELYFGDQRHIEQTEEAGLIHFDFQGKVDLRVITEFQVFSAKVLPLSKEVKVMRLDSNNGDELAFSISEPGQYVLEVNGIHMPLHIFADPIQTEIPDPMASNVYYIQADKKPSHQVYTSNTKRCGIPGGKDIIYFGPGVHYVGVLELQSNQTLYLHGGAVVCAAVRATKQSNIKVMGRGILYGGMFSRNLEPSLMHNLLLFEECENVCVEGVTLMDSVTYNFATSVCCNMEIRNVKILSWRKNSDGIDLHNSEHVLIKDCFLRCFDDCVTLKGQNLYNGYPCNNRPLRDIRVEHCTIWCDWGRALEIGAETSGPYISDIVFSNCEVLHFSFIACDVQACGTAPVSDIFFENIRIGEALDPQVEPRIIEAFIHPMIWMPNEPLSNVRNIVFRNISYQGKVIAPCRFVAYSDEHNIQGVTLENIMLNGRKMETPNEVLSPIVCNEFATEITLNGEPIDRTNAVYESKADTRTLYQIGNGAFIRT